MKKKLESAKWFVDALRQRHTTLMTTMQAILDYQRDYFRDGDETKIKPMILKDIADKTGYDISTVSRVANSKYIETHFGIFPLKYFFSESIRTRPERMSPHASSRRFFRKSSMAKTSRSRSPTTRLWT